MNYIITASNISFKSDNPKVLDDLIIEFGNNFDICGKSEHGIFCRIPVNPFGFNILTHKIDIIKTKFSEIELKEYYEKVLYRQNDGWQRINDKATRTVFEPIKAESLKAYLNLLLETPIDTNNYVWVLENQFHHPQDTYKGLFCKFTTDHSNPNWDWEYKHDKRDYCMVSERYKDEPIEWIKLEDGKEIKGDNITFIAKKIIIDIKINELVQQLLKAIKVAEKYGIEISKNGDS